MRLGLPLLTGLLLVTLCGCSSSVRPPASADLRLRRVILYQNGIGYFERTGLLRDDVVRMRFREEELDDVLKSLVVVEEGLGPDDRPSTVSARLAQKGSTREGAEPGALDLVLSPHTERPLAIAYAVPTATWKATYRIILPDPRSASPRGALLQAWALIDNVSDEDWTGVSLTLATGAPLSYASNLRDPQFVSRPQASVSGGLPTSTGAVGSERVAAADADRDGIPDADDACPREPGGADNDPHRNGCPRQLVVISGQEIRITQQVRFRKGSATMLPESAPVVDAVAQVLLQHREIKALELQGHASPDEADRDALAARRAEAVRAALVAKGVGARLTVKGHGASRPIVENSTEANRALNRRVEFIRTDSGSEGNREEGDDKRGLREQREQREQRERRPPAGAVTPEALAKGQPPLPVPSDVGGSVRYDVPDAVSIPRHSSALVTIVNAYLPGEDIYLFRPESTVPGSAEHPLRAARLENKAALGLQPGSAAIFAGGTFVGEGLLGKVNPGETTLVPYALDSSTDVQTSREDDESPVKIVAISRGVLTVEDAASTTTRYAVRAGMLSPARMFVRHERRQGWEAEGLPPQTEPASGAYLVPLSLTPGKASELSIVERSPVRRSIALAQIDARRLGRYIDGGGLPDEVAARLKAAQKLRADLARLDDEAAGLSTQIAEASRRTEELRENLKTVDRSPRARELHQKLLDRLNEATAHHDALTRKLAEKTVARSDADTQLSAIVRELSFEQVKPTKT